MTTVLVVGTGTMGRGIAQVAAAAERTVGMHFFNPPPAMPLVELVRGMHTDARVLDRCRELAVAFGKTAIVVNDSPGFATSRLGVAVGAEAIRMLEAGVASVE